MTYSTVQCWQTSYSAQLARILKTPAKIISYLSCWSHSLTVSQSHSLTVSQSHSLTVSHCKSTDGWWLCSSDEVWRLIEGKTWLTFSQTRTWLSLVVVRLGSMIQDSIQNDMLWCMLTLFIHKQGKVRRHSTIMIVPYNDPSTSRFDRFHTLSPNSKSLLNKKVWFLEN